MLKKLYLMNIQRINFENHKYYAIYILIVLERLKKLREFLDLMHRAFKQTIISVILYLHNILCFKNYIS